MFDPNLLRGVKVGGKGKFKTPYSLPGRVNRNCWGTGPLVNGQWCSSRVAHSVIAVDGQMLAMIEADEPAIKVCYSTADDIDSH